MEAPSFHVNADPNEAEFLMKTKTAVNQLSMWGNKSLSETVESQNQDVSCIVPPVLVSRLTKHETQIVEAQYGESRCENKLKNPKASSGTQLAQVCRATGCAYVVDGKYSVARSGILLKETGVTDSCREYTHLRDEVKYEPQGVETTSDWDQLLTCWSQHNVADKELSFDLIHKLGTIWYRAFNGMHGTNVR